MTDNQRQEVKINGNSFELDAQWADSGTKLGLFGFLSEHTRHHPWIVGIAAICGSAVMVPSEAIGSTIISCVAITAITVITILAMKRKKCACEKQDKLSRFGPNEKPAI